MTPRARLPRPSARTAGGLAATLLVLGCTLCYPGEGSASLELRTGPASAAPDRTGPPPAGRQAAAPAASSPSGSPVTAPGLADGPACPTARPTGWLAAENQRQGTPLTPPPRSVDGIHDAYGGAAVVGYTDRSSAACGELVTVQLSGPAGAVQLVAYRIGSYRGAGARAVWRSGPIRVSPREVPPGDAFPHLVEPQWPLSTTIAVDGRWTPGFYLLVPVGSTGRPAGPAVPLTVRNDGGRAPVLFKASTLTWNAYGDWSGWSLYHGARGSGAAATAARARVVSLHRPLVEAGYEQMEYMDLPVVRQLEQLGLDVDYTTDEDVDAAPESLLGHAEVVMGGHSEYWTRAMYDGLLRAGEAGVNLVFLGANNLWWQARLERSPLANRPDRMAVYRVAAEDPVTRSDPKAATVLWGQLGRDPAAVLGESHAAIGVHGGLQVLDAPAWFLAGSGLTTGSVLPGAVGNEAAGYNVRGKNPPTTQVLAAGVLRGAHGPVVVSANYSTLPSGAAVFAAGSTDWACLPSPGGCLDGTPPGATASAVGVLTRNVLLALSTPRAGLTRPSTPTTPFVAAQLLPRLAPAAIGSYGAPTAEEGTGPQD
jgi:hypothetical protein